MNISIKIRKWAAILALTFALFYSIFQVLSLMHLIAKPYDLVAMFIPSLLLAPAFVVVIVSMQYSHSNESKIFGLSAAGFAFIYCILASGVYFTQLTSVIPLQLHNEKVDQLLLFEGTNIMVAIDCLAYAFMSLSSLFIAFSFTNHKRLFLSFFAHGLLLPFIIASFFYPALLAIGALWMITFPWAMIEVIRYCKPETPGKKHNVVKSRVTEQELSSN